MDKFAKAHERDALWPGFRAAQEEVDRLRGRNPSTIDFKIHMALNRVLAHDYRPRRVSRTQMLMLTWLCGKTGTGACGAESSMARHFVSLTDPKFVVYQNCLRVVFCMLNVLVHFVSLCLFFGSELLGSSPGRSVLQSAK